MTNIPIKQLKWRRDDRPLFKHYDIVKTLATSPLGVFIIQKYSRGGYMMRGPIEYNDHNDLPSGSHYWTMKEAKNAAQEEFERIVRECLSAK